MVREASSPLGGRMPNTPATRGEVAEVAAEAARLAAAQAALVRSEKMTRSLVFLALFMVLVFGVLFIRTEANSREIREGFQAACEQRRENALHANDGREALIAVVINGPNVPPAQRDALLKQLRDGLLLPVESCG